MEDARNLINTYLVKLINQIWDLEEKAIITEEFKDITNNDMHVIEAVGLTGGSKMSVIAKKLNITVGSLTSAMNNLVKKGYVDRYRTEEDRRVVLVKLTERGEAAYHHHEKYHEELTNAVFNALDESEIPVLAKTLDALADFFHEYHKDL